MVPDILAPRYVFAIASRYAQCKAGRYVIQRMKTVEEVRRERLVQLRDELGTLVALNEKLGLSKRDSTLSQILNGSPNSKTKKAKWMGSPLARRLEDACHKDRGWMDTDPDLLGGIALTPEAHAIAAGIDRIPPSDERDRCIRLCRILVEEHTPRGKSQAIEDVSQVHGQGKGNRNSH